MLTGDRAGAAAADYLQAQRLRKYLEEERGGLAARLCQHATTLTEHMEASDMRRVSFHRGHMRELESEIQAVNRILDALDARFPPPEARRRA